MKALICPRCGETLHEEDGRYLCHYCGAAYTKEEGHEAEDALRSIIEEAKTEALANRRRVLWDTTHQANISTLKVFRAASDVREVYAEDTLARFYLAALDDDPAVLNAFLLNETVDGPIAKEVTRFALTSITSRSVLSLRDFIEANIDEVEGQKLLEELSDLAKKLDEGVYLTNIPRDVFLAYRSTDMAKVIEIADLLEANHFSVFVAARNLRHGKGAQENYEKLLFDALSHCKCLVFLSSESSRTLECDALKFELPYARDNLPRIGKVEYLLEPYGRRTQSSAKTVLETTFHGLEWCTDPNDLIKRVASYVTVTAKKCFHCGEVNDAYASHCHRCGYPLDKETYQKRIEAERKAKEEAEAAERKRLAEREKELQLEKTRLELERQQAELERRLAEEKKAKEDQEAAEEAKRKAEEITRKAEELARKEEELKRQEKEQELKRREEELERKAKELESRSSSSTSMSDEDLLAAYERAQKKREEDRKNAIYKKGKQLEDEGKFQEAASAYKQVPGFKDADTRVLEAGYKEALSLKEAGQYDAASSAFRLISSYRDAANQVKECLRLREEARKKAVEEKNQAAYLAAIELLEKGQYDEAANAFKALGGYLDAKEQIANVYQMKAEAIKRAEQKALEERRRKEEAAKREEQARKDAIYQKALELKKTADYLEAIKAFREIAGHKDADEQIAACGRLLQEAKKKAEEEEKKKKAEAKLLAEKETQYKNALKLKKSGRYNDAIESLSALSGFKDAAEQVKECKRLRDEVLAKYEKVKKEIHENEAKIASAEEKRTSLNQTLQWDRYPIVKLPNQSPFFWGENIDYKEIKFGLFEKGKVLKSPTDEHGFFLYNGKKYFHNQSGFYETTINNLHWKLGQKQGCIQYLVFVGGHNKETVNEQILQRFLGQDKFNHLLPLFNGKKISVSRLSDGTIDEVQIAVKWAYEDPKVIEQAKSECEKLTKEIESLSQRSEALELDRKELRGTALKCVQPKPFFDDGFIYYGEYPQSKTDASLNSILNEEATDKDGYVEHDGRRYAKRKKKWFLVEPIKWKILSKDGNELYLLSESLLDVHRYDRSSHDFASSEVRRWLNDAFLSKAFKDTSSIVENEGNQVSLPSKDDMENPSFGFRNDDARLSKPTDYAVAGMAYQWDSYWTKTPDPGNSGHAWCVSNGELGRHSVNYGYYCVRPALHIHLD